MKKTLALLLMFLTVFTMAACDDNDEEKDPDLERVEEAKSRLVIPERQDQVVDDVTLTSQLGFYPDVEITWESSHPDLIDADGEVNRPGPGEDNVRVTLTATLSLDDASVEREFQMLVLAEEE